MIVACSTTRLVEPPSVAWFQRNIGSSWKPTHMRSAAVAAGTSTAAASTATTSRRARSSTGRILLVRGRDPGKLPTGCEELVRIVSTSQIRRRHAAPRLLHASVGRSHTLGRRDLGDDLHAADPEDPDRLPVRCDLVGDPGRAARGGAGVRRGRDRHPVAAVVTDGPRRHEAARPARPEPKAGAARSASASPRDRPPRAVMRAGERGPRDPQTAFVGHRRDRRSAGRRARSCSPSSPWASGSCSRSSRAPARLAPVAVIVALVAARMSERYQRLAFKAAVIGAMSPGCSG